METAVLAGGCFWCLEPIFASLAGVVRAVPGYAGGHVAEPSYEAVCAGDTGHAEAVEVTFDPQVITYRELLEVFFAVHDPTTPGRQGADVGSQYRSAVFCRSREQEEAARAAVVHSALEPWWEGGSVVTEIVPSGPFYAAEEYHKGYFARHPDRPYCRAVISPKLAKLRGRFASRIAQAGSGG